MTIEKTVADIKPKSSKTSSLVIKRIKYTLKLAWACTLDKAQDFSLTHIVFSFKQFNYGQIFFALSRVSTL